MKGLLFGCLPVFPLPDWIAHAYPHLVPTHFVFVLLGVVMLCIATFLLAASLLLLVMPQPYREVLQWGMWLFAWGLGFSILGLYAIPFALMAAGAVGYRQSSWN